MARSCLRWNLSYAGVAAVMLGTTALSSAALAQDARHLDFFNRHFAQNFTTNSSTSTSTTTTQTQRPVDPGVRGGAPGAGDSLPGLSQNEINFFKAAQDIFNEVETVEDGLGPRFNLDSCGGCHVHPAAGGSSPATNPQVKNATVGGAKNVVPPFITANGPIREARFIRNPDGTPDGGVHDLFVITGRADAPGCNIQQPNFAAALAANNVIFRIPTPTFGLGLVEAVPDDALQTALAANGRQKAALGISGTFNRTGNDGTITRFGWKAQNKSLLIFSGEAYNVEMGVTNDAFPNERETNPACQFNNHPESATNLVNKNNSGSPASDFSSDIVNFTAFMRMLAPPTPATAPTAAASSSVQVASATNSTSVLSAAAGSTSSTSSTSTATVTRGSQVFANVGCQACHTVSLTTGKSNMTGQSNKTFQPYSDFAVHNMGQGLADNVSQGNANGMEFRTAPLWGVGQRIFFLHDGRTNDLYTAIQQHASRGSEANEVIRNYNLLSLTDQQALLNYLRSL
jgi:CxxC motif-containing protein (DUF1111 family)